MSHHYSGPNTGFPHDDARLDVTDLFVFPKPGDAEKSILILDAHPSVAIQTQEPTTREPFSPDALYELRIDTNGDSVADIAYRIRFSSFADGKQTATLRYAEGAQVAGMSDDGRVIMDGVPVSVGREALITEANGYRFFAGWRSDPFFFDVLGVLNGFKFSGKDFFSDKDVCSIVLEVPNSVLGPNAVGIWMRTLDGHSGHWTQADRGGKPSQAVFLPGDDREAYLTAEPAGDAQFVDTFAHSLEHTGGYARVDAERVARTLLPDIMRYDHKRAAAYPDNGRALTDDVMDHFLSILTNGKVTTDGVGAHTDLLADFPYLGPPHGAPASK